MALRSYHRGNRLFDDQSLLLLNRFIMNKWGAKLLFLIFTILFYSIESSAQCAMCRTTLENNVSNGEIGITAGINFGILYLFAAPYLVIASIAFLWYKTSKRIAKNESKGSLAR